MNRRWKGVKRKKGRAAALQEGEGRQGEDFVEEGMKSKVKGENRVKGWWWARSEIGELQTEAARESQSEARRSREEQGEGRRVRQTRSQDVARWTWGRAGSLATTSNRWGVLGKKKYKGTAVRFVSILT